MTKQQRMPSINWFKAIDFDLVNGVNVSVTCHSHDSLESVDPSKAVFWIVLFTSEMWVYYTSRWVHWDPRLGAKTFLKLITQIEVLIQPFNINELNN